MPLILILVLALAVLIRVSKKKGVREAKQKSDEFWAREHDANFTRAKDISGLDYITIPFSQLPFSENPEDDELRSVERQLKKLENQPIADLSAYTNTELKLEFGAPNFVKLSTADQNYTILIRSLDKWARLLIADNRPEEAEKVLEYAIECKSTIGTTYKNLAELYAASGKREEVEKLLEIVSSLHSPTAASLQKSLKSIADNL